MLSSNVYDLKLKPDMAYRVDVCPCAVPWASGAGLYLGIVALFVTGPVGVGIGIGGLAFGGLGLFTGC
jgi:hypothetical protein